MSIASFANNGGKTTVNASDPDSIPKFSLGLAITAENAITSADFGSAGMNSAIFRNYFIDRYITPITGRVVSEKEVGAFFLIGMSTYTTKQENRVSNVMSVVSQKLGLEAELTTVTQSLGQIYKEVSLTMQRLATSFPDLGIFGKAMSSKSLSDEITVLTNNGEITAKVPTVLSYAQSLQLHLDDRMQVIANNFNRYYWLKVVKSRSEVTGGPHFVYDYHLTSKDDKYLLLIPNNINVDQGLMNKYFTPPYSIHSLIAYHALVKNYAKGVKNFNLSDFEMELNKTDGDKKSPYYNTIALYESDFYKTIINPTNDERRDSIPITVKSGTSEYSEQKFDEMQTRVKRVNRGVRRT